MYWDNIPRLLHAFNPQLKLLFLIRNPIDRAYSQYCMHLSAGTVTSDIREALAPGGSIAGIGLYYSYLQRFLQHFPSSQIKILVYDDLKQDANSYLTSAYEFIGVDTRFRPEILDKAYHVRPTRKRFPMLHRVLTRSIAPLLANSRMAAQLYIKIRSRGGLKFYHWLLGRSNGFPVIPDDLHESLADYYADDLRGISSFLGRDFTHWMSDSASGGGGASLQTTDQGHVPRL